MIAVARALVRSLPVGLRRRVRAVGVAAQMHGVLLLDRRGRPLTPFVTWQDARAAERPVWLDALRRRAGRPLHPGYGAVTLAWWASGRERVRGAACAANIGDLAVADLCGIARPAVSASIAHSWGLCDATAAGWDPGVAARLGIPFSWLPAMVPDGGAAGVVASAGACGWGLPPGIPVAATVGDQQAAALATLRDPATDIAITIGTGAQVAIVTDVATTTAAPEATWEVRPFFDGRALLTAASLNGGAAWLWFARAVRRWCAAATGRAPDEMTLFLRLNRLGLRARKEAAVVPQWYGERTDGQTARGAILDLGAEPPDLGALARGVARGLARNLRLRLPPEALQGRRRVVGSGNALRRNPLLRAMIREEFGLPLAMTRTVEETATGAALVARRLADTTSRSFKAARRATLR